MTPEEFTKTQTVNVIYDPNGQHILEKHVYELMQDYTEQQLDIQRVSQQRELLIGLLTKLENGGGSAFIDKEQIVDDYLKAN